MNWKALLVTAGIASIIIFVQWPKMKQYSKKEKTTVIVLLGIGILFSMFHLKDIIGPIEIREMVLKPFVKYMQK